MSDLFETDLVKKYNERLAAAGRNDVRWRWRNPRDHDAGMVLDPVYKPASKLVGR